MFQGTLGSGKTTLIRALVEAMKLLSGKRYGSRPCGGLPGEIQIARRAHVVQAPHRQSYNFV